MKNPSKDTTASNDIQMGANDFKLSKSWKVTDEQDFVIDTKSTEFLNMMICKAIATGDELAWIKNL